MLDDKEKGAVAAAPAGLYRSSPEQLKAIPQELQELKQWVCWRYEAGSGEKPTKVPVQPNGMFASVDNPLTWHSFETCANTVLAYPDKFTGVGFVFSENDPYVGIDLDKLSDLSRQELQSRIYTNFDSYSEYSPSKDGIHIIISVTDKTKLWEGIKRTREGVELYCQGRYFTFTGNFCGTGPKPIAERQQFAEILWAELGKGQNDKPTYEGEAEEQYDDEDIIQQALSAADGDKFRLLLDDKWHETYKHDRSSADLAFVNIIAFYTNNKEQVKRIWRNSLLGQRDKVQKRKDYVDRTIALAFDQKLPPIEFERDWSKVQAGIAAAKAGAHTNAGGSQSVSPLTAVHNASGKAKATDDEKLLIGGPVANYEAKSTEWLWPSRFPLGMVSLVSGNPGLGKSQLMTKIAACVSTGAAWPDGSGNAPKGSVIMLSCEDSVTHTIRPRLEAAEADLSKVYNFNAIKGSGGTRNISIIEDMDQIERAIETIKDVKLIIIDPISAYLDKIDTHTTSQVRSALTEIQINAEKYNIAVILVSHFNKGKGKGNSLDATTGSNAFVAVARAYHIVEHGQEDHDGLRVFAPAKINITKLPEAILYQVKSKKLSNGIDTSCLYFKGTADINADDLLNSDIPGRKPIVRNDAEELLRKILAHGPVPASQVKDQASAQGISEQTLRRAKMTLNIVVQKRGFADNPHWTWELPPKCQPNGIFEANLYMKH